MSPSFANSYIEPGVYVKISDVVVPSVPAGVMIPCIVGIGSKIATITEKFTMQTLNEKRLLANTPVILIVSAYDYIKGYVPTTDYTLGSGADANKIVWTPGGSQPSVGSEYYVTYQYEKVAEDYNHKIFSKLQDIIDFYGPANPPVIVKEGLAQAPFTATTLKLEGTHTINAYVGYHVKIIDGTGEGQIRVILSNTADTLTIGTAWGTTLDATSRYQVMSAPDSSISIGAAIVYENFAGAGYVAVCQAKDDTIASFKDAIDRVQEKTLWALIVMKPVIGTDELIAYIKNHVLNQSSTIVRFERIAIMGAPVGTTDEADFITVATGLKTSRCAFLSPSDSERDFNGDIRILDGSYLSAAVGAIVTNPIYDAGEPISGKTVIGFSNIKDNFLRHEKNLMAGNGVMVIEQQGGAFVIRHALTTDPSTPITQELKVQKIKDYIIITLRDNLTRTFINTRNVGNATILQITTFVRMLLDVLIGMNIITAYQNLEVKQNAVEPRQIDVNFMVKPTWDINWIYIIFGATI